MGAVTEPRASSGTDIADVALLVAGTTQLLLGVLALVAPGTFYAQIGPFPPENSHFIQDIGSWQVALGAAALYAVRRPGWRMPMLGILALQFVLHTISHIIDVNEADPEWQGPAALVAVGFGAVVLSALFLRERGR